MNRLGQSGETMLGWDTAACARRARAFGWHAIEVDGHNLNEIDAAYSEAERHTDGPTAIIARTLMGEGFSDVEDRDAWHGKPLRSEMAERAVSELGGVRNMIVVPRAPTVAAPPDLGSGEPLKLPEYEPGKGVATRKAYGEALAAVGAARTDVVVLDGELSNSTFAELFAEAHRTAISKCSSPSNRWLPRLLGCKLAGMHPSCRPLPRSSPRGGKNAVVVELPSAMDTTSQVRALAQDIARHQALTGPCQGQPVRAGRARRTIIWRPSRAG